MEQEEYCKIIEKIINQNLFWKGVKHIYSPTSKNKYELAIMISKSFKLNNNVDKTLSSKFQNEF